MTTNLKQAHGNWVAGERFWDREDDIKLFIQRIEEGAHILLVAQRRMGKTSLLKEIERRLQDKYVCLFIDLQRADNPADFLVELSKSLRPYQSLWNKTKEVFANILDRLLDRIDTLNLGEIGITLRAGLTSANWSDKPAKEKDGVLWG